MTSPDISFVETGNVLAAALSNTLILIGVARLRVSRLVAYRWFKRGILVSIFLVQFFSFYREELIAVVFLLVDLALLVTLDFVISRERGANAATPTAASDPIAERAVAVS